MTRGNVLIVGVGGQGTILASDILSQAALEAGLEVKKSEIHGMSQRGGSVFSHVRFGQRVYSPVIPYGEVDLLLSLEELEAARWVDWLTPEGRALVLGTRIMPANLEVYPEGLDSRLVKGRPTSLFISHEDLIREIKNIKYASVFILGMASGAIEFPESAWYSAIERLVPQGTYEANRAAFIAGRGYQ